MHTQFPKNPFLESEDLKTYKSGKNSTSKILISSNISVSLTVVGNESKKETTL